MQFSKLSITAFLGLLASSAMAAPAPDSVDARSADAAPKAEAFADEIPTLSKRGFGCPWDEDECHDHCASIDGYKGGYCDKLGFRCKCY